MNKKINIIRVKDSAFTLAEVLITLTIVGIVAAMTIPTLIANIQDKVTKRQIQVTQRKISQGVEEMQVHGELLDGFSSTREFVDGLSKYMKISQICDSDHLRQCWQYDKIKVDDEGTEREVAKQKDGAKAFHMENGEWGETIGVTFGNGVQMLLAYRKDCAVEDDVRFDTDKDSGISGATKCLAGVWELNGANGKNKYGEDVLPFNAQGFGGSACAFEYNDVCYGAPFKPIALSKSTCSQYKSQGLIDVTYCHMNNDYYAGAVYQCGGKKANLPSSSDLVNFFGQLYQSASSGPYSYALNTSEYSLLGDIGIGDSIWTNRESDGNGAYYVKLSNYPVVEYGYINDQLFGHPGGRNSGLPRSTSSIYAVCIME